MMMIIIFAGVDLPRALDHHHHCHHSQHNHHAYHHVHHLISGVDLPRALGPPRPPSRNLAPSFNSSGDNLTFYETQSETFYPFFPRATIEPLLFFLRIWEGYKYSRCLLLFRSWISFDVIAFCFYVLLLYDLVTFL